MVSGHFCLNCFQNRIANLGSPLCDSCEEDNETVNTF